MTPSFDLSRYQDPLIIQRVLHNARTIALVGGRRISCAPAISSGSTSGGTGTSVNTVNPRETEIFGEKSFKSLVDLPVPVDVVNVFRAPEALPGIAEEAVAIGRHEPLVSVFGDQ